MSPALLIAWNDLRLFLKEKSAYFWLFGSPLMFAFFMGFANKGPGDPANPRPSVLIENHDTGFVGAAFVKELGAQGLNVTTKDARAERGIRIPTNTTAQVLAKKPVKLQVFRTQDSPQDAGMLVEAKMLRALVALNSYFLESSGTVLTEQSLSASHAKPNPVQLDVQFATRKPIPTGNKQSVPGVLVMFIMMNLLIFGGATVASERREGVLKRILAQPISKLQLVIGKIIGLVLLGGVQIAVLLIAAKFAMDMSFNGTLPLLLLTCLIYAAVAGAGGVLIGSIISREDKVVAICVLASMVMAAMGGSWWPLEIVPEKVRLAGHLFPSAWAMDAMHQLISFGGGFAEIIGPLAVLSAYALVGGWCAARFFRA